MPQDGIYYIGVCAMEGWSNYVMNIGNTTVLNIASIDQQDNFIPGEVIVNFNDEKPVASASRSLQGRADSLGLLAKSGVPGGTMLFKVGDEAQRKNAMARLGITMTRSAARAAMSESEKLRQDTFSIVKALQAIERAHIVVLMMDAGEGYTDQDATLLGHVLEHGCIEPAGSHTVRRQLI